MVITLQNRFLSASGNDRHVKMNCLAALVWLIACLPWTVPASYAGDEAMAAAALMLMAGGNTALSTSIGPNGGNPAAQTAPDPVKNTLKGARSPVNNNAVAISNPPLLDMTSATNSSDMSADQSETNATPAVANENTLPQAELDKEYDRVDKRIKELIQQPAVQSDAASDKGSSPLYIQGKLQELEKKAFEYNALKSEIDNRDARISDLTGGLRDAGKLINKQRAEICRLDEAVKSLGCEAEQLKVEREKFKETLKILQLGNFEYYEIKPGDTCESIAADPAIYGDETEAHHIRQANYRNVTDLEHLTPGQILIIPRYPDPTSGKYAF